MKYIYVIILLILTQGVVSQNITGKVYDHFTKEPLESVVIKNKETGSWATSNEEGFFELSIKKLPIRIEFQYLGKKTILLLVSQNKNLEVFMKDDNLELEEVVVTAKAKKNSTGSNIVLGKQAVELVQAQSLADIMQLIPGKSISESNLHTKQILTLRSAIFGEKDKFNTKTGLGKINHGQEHLINNAFGIGYLVDGIPVSNNADLSGNRGLNVGMFNNITDFNAVGYGVDLRSLGLDNIENIEVIQGISSARYGDHSTGLVKIKKAVGRSPYRIHTTLRGGSSSLQLTKGYKLGAKLGFANFGLEYLHSNRDPRSTLTKFDRIRINGKWQYLKSEKMKNTFAIDYSQTLDNYNVVRSKTIERAKKYKSRKLRISNTNHLYFNSNWIDALETAISVNYEIRDTKSEQLVNSGGNPISNSLKEGTFVVGYTPINYTTVEAVNSKPFSLFTRVEALKTVETKKSNYKFTLGANVIVEDNFGEGTVFNPEESLIYSKASPSGRSGWRSINFNETLPTEIKISGYGSVKIDTQIANKKINSYVGFRYDNYNGKSAFSPRVNAKLHWSEQFKTRFGVGFFVKAPSLQSIYRPTAYHDFLLADYRNNFYSFALAHTFVRNYTTNNVEPSKMWKFELGTDYSNKWLNTSLTAYYNKQFNGFTSTKEFEIAKLPKYDFTVYPKKAPDYKQVGHYNTLIQSRKTVNDLISENYGLELMVNTKKIASINTSFSMSMAYRYTKNKRNLPFFIFSKDATSAPYIGLHHNTPKEYKKLNSSITAVHHISELGLVISLTAEQFLMATSNTYGKAFYPYAYYDRNLNYIKIPKNEQENNIYIPIRSMGSTSEKDHIPKVFSNYHIKVAKEFKNGLRFSFYAINFLNHLPKAERINANGEITINRLNTPISFGGNITYKF